MRHLYYTLQTLLRGRGSNIIKVISLSLGLLMSVFLFARIVFELSFDNFYHEPENLYIVKTGWMNKGVLSGGEGIIPSKLFLLPLQRSFLMRYRVLLPAVLFLVRSIAWENISSCYLQ